RGGCSVGSSGEPAGVPASESCFSGACDIRSILTGPVGWRDKCCRSDVLGPLRWGALPSGRSGKSSVRAVIDLKLLRDDPAAVRRSQVSRGEDPALGDALLTAHAKPR